MTSLSRADLLHQLFQAAKWNDREHRVGIGVGALAQHIRPGEGPAAIISPADMRIDKGHIGIGGGDAVKGRGVVKGVAEQDATALLQDGVKPLIGRAVRRVLVGRRVNLDAKKPSVSRQRDTSPSISSE